MAPLLDAGADAAAKYSNPTVGYALIATWFRFCVWPRLGKAARRLLERCNLAATVRNQRSPIPTSAALTRQREFNCRLVSRNWRAASWRSFSPVNDFER